MMDFTLTEDQTQLREEIRKVCQDFSDPYWREVDAKGEYPEAFVRKLTELGWLAALIPEEYGGIGLGITEASIILEEINRWGGNATACHAQMYTMGTVLRHGSEEQKRRYLPGVASGEIRLQAFGVTRARLRHRDHAHPHRGRPQGRPLRGQRAEDLHLPGAPVGPDAAAGPDHAL